MIQAWSSNSSALLITEAWAERSLVSAGLLFGGFLRHRKIRNFDRIAIHVASQLDRVPSMLRQPGEILIFDAVHLALRHKHVFAAILDASFRTVAGRQLFAMLRHGFVMR